MQVSLKGSYLSTQQARLWPWHKENPSYRVQTAILMKGHLERGIVAKVCQRIVERHEILRTVFHSLPAMDLPVQTATTYEAWTCPIIDLEALELSSQQGEVARLIASLAQDMFDVEHGPLLHTWILHIAAQTHILLISLPALCADSFTLKLLVADLQQTYTAYLQGQSIDEEPLQYTDVSAWQNELLQEDDAEFLRQYWQKIDLSQLSNMRVPFEKGHTEDTHNSEAYSDSTFAPQVLSLVLEEPLMKKLQAAVQRSGVSVEAWLLTCWRVLYWRLNNAPTFLIGVARDGRMYEDLSDAIGLYTRFVPIDMQIEKDQPFEQLLSRVEQSLQQANKLQVYFNWEDMPGTANGMHANSSFPVDFEYDSWPASSTENTPAFEPYWHFSCIEPFVIKLSALQIGNQLKLQLYYDTQHIAPEQIEYLGALFRMLISSAVEEPMTNISHLEIISPRERANLLSWGNAATLPLPEQGLHQLFEAQALRTPDSLAVLSAQEELTYYQLNSRANRLARLLQQQGVGPNIVVGLSMQRSAHMLVGLLAILKAGGAYMPLDTQWPGARLTYQLHDAHPALLLTEQALLEHFGGWQGASICLEQVTEEMEKEAEKNLDLKSYGQELAYVLYTSGSTGVPKGVMISQRNVVNYTLAMCQQLEAEPGWHYATVSTLAADLGNTAIFCALATGGCVQVLDYATITSSENFARWTQQHPIDVLKIVPSHLSALLAYEQARTLLPRRRLVLGGEVFAASLQKRLQALGADCAVYNHYGPTETTIGVLVNASGKPGDKEEKHQHVEGTSVPLGRPLSGYEICVLDSNLQPVPFGVAGELYVGGEGVAQGYLHMAAQTAERFVPHPYSKQAGARLYRTGDLGYWTSEGQVVFVGRLDGQVKVRGYRVELEEIEAVLRQHPQVWDCAVTMREVGGESRIVGYVVAQSQSRSTREALQAFVQESLPDYMIPTSFVWLERLPLTINGKIDRRQLPEPLPSEESRTFISDAPRGPIESILLDIWQSLLATPLLSIHDNFFQLGGHSLLATQVISRVRAMLQVELPITSMFETPTIAGLAQQVEQALRGEHISAPPALTRGERPQDVPLSFAQQRLWFLDQLEPMSTTYLVSSTLEIRGTLHREALEHSLAEVINRHESLRTVFAEYNGQPVQRITPAGAYRLPLVDLSDLSAQERPEEAHRLAHQERERPFDLTCGPLLRSWLLWLAPQEHILLLTLHHIITDGWSNTILQRELGALYQAFVAGQSSPLEPLAIQYADYALWQRNWLQGEVLQHQLDYWKQQLAGLIPLDLPTDHLRPPVPSGRGASQSVLLAQSLQQELIALSQQEGATLFMTLLAAFQILLARYSGQQDISVGTPIANRRQAEVEGLIGFFVNTLVLRSDLSGQPGFVELLGRVRQVALGAYAYQDVPFEMLVEQLEPQRDLSRSPLFQVMFSLQQPLEMAETLEGAVLRSLEIESGVSKFDLNMTITSQEQGLVCHLNYNTDLFEADTIQRLLQHWSILLEGIVATPHARLSELPLLSDQERRTLLLDWNNTHTLPSEGRCLHTLFEEQVARTPDAVAVGYDDEQLTYATLLTQAAQLAAHLKKLGVGPETIVALLDERGIPLLKAMLAVFLLEGAYLPLDPRHPPARWQQILQRSAVPVVIAGVALVKPLESVLASWSSKQRPIILTETKMQKESAQVEIARWHHPQQLAYVIYTSGSTGVPKGVMVTQQGMLNHLEAKISSLGLTKADTLAQTASQCFDISVWQFLAPLLVGGRVQILPDTQVHEPQALMAGIQRYGVHIIELVPSLLRALLEVADHLEACATELLALRWLIPTGEALPLDLAQDWLTRFPTIPLVNAYGPTECSDDVTHHMLFTIPEPQEVVIPIGQPVCNTQIYLLDAYCQPVPIGVTGEVYVGGLGVGRGYLGDPARTSEWFVPDPFGRSPGGRLYRTGDLARYRANGNLEFLGRSDQQVKLRGYRIELGEIEAVLGQDSEIRQSVVVLRKDMEGEARLVAYVVSQGASEELLEKQIRGYLREKLPAYMIPQNVVVLQELPVSTNGKVDRAALPAPVVSSEKTNNQLIGPRSPVEELLSNVWSQVLGRPARGRDESFFEAGGHSLLATQLVARVRRLLHIELPLRSLFEAPTISGLAQRVEQVLRSGQGEVVPALVARERPHDLPLSFAQQRLWFLDRLEPESTDYLVHSALRIQGTLHCQALELSLQEMIQRHEILRTTFEERNGQPVQHVASAGAYCLPPVDLRDLNAQKRQEEVLLLAHQERERPFDLARGPLLRTILLRLTSEEHILLLSMHHIIIDGWSSAILQRELEVLYQAFVAGRPSPLEPLPFQYADYALWQRDWLQGELLQHQLDYWKERLMGATALNLPTGHPRSELQSHNGASYIFALPDNLSADLAALSRQEGVTLFMTLLAAFQTLLYRSTGQSDIVVGTDIANRARMETEALAGFFVNLLALRTDLSGFPTFRNVLRRVREVVLGVYTHQDVPFEMLVEYLRLERKMNQTPLIQVLFVLQNTPVPAQTSSMLTFEPMQQETTRARFDLALFLDEDSHGLNGKVVYRTDLFEEHTIRTMMAQFNVLLQSIVTEPDTSIDVLDIHTASEKREYEKERQNIHRSDMHKLKNTKGKRLV